MQGLQRLRNCFPHNSYLPSIVKLVHQGDQAPSNIYLRKRDFWDWNREASELGYWSPFLVFGAGKWHFVCPQTNIQHIPQ